ncbi:hypothetical protein FSP39_009733 [Pinctada imbricata]|uniref:C2 domain-containing protein n=1 Tax=Pinctada imbricata TaxID=66713 RepID=A0AA88YCM3_PINIB|nr:hypothetical protein FSP39_009733 [Pinctada imbricata]
MSQSSFQGTDTNGAPPGIKFEVSIDEAIMPLGRKNDGTMKDVITHDTLKILLVGAGDLRHTLTTVARSYRHKKCKLHFYVLENSLELYCRHMLFLALALETPNRMGLQEKTELFMELFGNLLIRKQSSEYIEKMANEFIHMVTDFDYLEEKIPNLDLSQLKFKERDFMEAIFKFWRNPDATIFDAEKCWDLRQRQFLGTRYDTRHNAYDWDYHMRLVEREADIIHRHEYKNWRSNGVAFEPREASYDTPNKTLASGMIFNKDGEKHARRGYWGDILVSPFISMGLICEEKSFYKKSNNQYTKLSLHVMEHNLLSMFHEMTTKTPYVPPQPEEKPKKDDSSKQAKITGARLNDVFVTIQLAKEKFQTSTIKNAVNPEWFEQCDLAIPSMQSDVQIHVMHRGMLTDDFIGYCSIPLCEYNLYDRPKSQWIHLQGKPHKPPDNKIRGDIEVRVSFQVKSTTEEALSPGLKKSKSPSLKALTSIGQKMGDKLKFARSRSFRESRSPEAPKQANGAMPQPIHNDNVSHRFITTEFFFFFFVADDVQYNMRMPGNRQSLPPSYWATQTLPYHKGKRYGMSVHRSAENVNTLSPGQPGYLESMFKKEREVYHSMQQQERNHNSSESSDDERETHSQVKPRRYAKEYSERPDSDSDSDSVKSDEDIALPEVKRKESATENIKEECESANEKLVERSDSATDKIKEEAENTQPENSGKVMNNLSPVMSESTSHSHQEKDENNKSFTETSFLGNEEPFDTQRSKSDIKDKTSKTSAPPGDKVNGERQITAPPRHRKKIAPSQNFTFGQSPDKPEVENPTRRRPKKERDRLRKLYKQGGRRYTVQGLDFPRRQNSFEEALVDLRPQFPQEMVIPQDLITVYRNMTKEELIQLVIQHKAQLIRKDQYVKDMEDYIDNLLVRVMESSPRLLQHNNPPQPRQWHF